MLEVYTARMGYRGPDRLDVTRLGDSPFAPSWGLLNPYLKLRSLGRLTDERWEEYRAGYIAEMRRSYLHHRPAWSALLGRRKATLLCFCPDPERCHRRVLAGLLVKAGAVDRGERRA